MNARLGTVRAILLVAGGLFVLHAESAHAQWVQSTGPQGGSIRSLLSVPNGSGTSLYAGAFRVWRTDNSGASWSQLGNGLTDPNPFSLIAVPNGSGSHDILAGTNGGVFRSTDGGASWSAINNGLTNLTIYSLAAGPNGSSGTNLYAGGFLGNAFRSTDNGASWTAMTTGLPVGQAHVHSMITTASGTVLAGTGNGVYRSTNFGASFTRVVTFQGLSLTRNGATILAGTSNGVYRSTNDGATWTAINNGMNFTWTYSVAIVPNGSGATLFAGAGRVMRSTDNGATWQITDNGLPIIGIYAMTTAPNPGGGTDLYAGTPQGIFRTSDLGATWTNASFISSFVEGLEVTPSGAVLASTENDVFRSTDGGSTWTDTELNARVHDFAINPTGTSGVSVFAGGSTSGTFRSSNDGVTWVDVNNDMSDTEVNSLGTVPNGAGGHNVIAGTYGGIFVSTNDGGHWTLVEPNFMPLDFVVTPDGSGGHIIYGGGFGGVLKSTNAGLTWTVTPLEGLPTAMAATGNGTNVFAGGDFGVYRSTNQGASWTLVNSGLADIRINSLVTPDGTNLFAGGAGGVFLSADNGNSWTSVSTGLTTAVSALGATANGFLVAGTAGVGVWRRPLSEMIDVAPPPPPSAPSIASFAPASGPVGTQVTVLGSNFTGATAVRFNGTASVYTVDSGSQIRATVPSGATTGAISVTTPAGTGTSAGVFTVTTPPPPPPTTLTFSPSDDAYVRSTSTSSNFGSARELRVRSSSQTIRSYLKFSVTGVTGSVQSATLRLRVRDAGPNGGSVFSVSNNFAGTSAPWFEEGLTWRNAPPVTGSALDAAGAVAMNAWIELDVTAAITGNGTYSFALSGGSSDVVDYVSKEGTSPPQLVVVASQGASRTQDTARGEVTSIRAEMVLHANHPNPFSASTTIHFALPRAASARLVVYDISGRAVRTLLDGMQEAGDRRVTWDGRDDAGARLGPGLYMVRLEAAGTRLTRKMSLLK